MIGTHLPLLTDERGKLERRDEVTLADTAIVVCIMKLKGEFILLVVRRRGAKCRHHVHKVAKVDSARVARVENVLQPVR
eukprot:SAG11_NODE_1389_length_5057_cov_16.280355_6_plen_79_part_00